MQKSLILAVLYLAIGTSTSHAFSHVACIQSDGRVRCFASVGKASEEEAYRAAQNECKEKTNHLSCYPIHFSSGCLAVAAQANEFFDSRFIGAANTSEEAASLAGRACIQNGLLPCRIEIAICEPPPPKEEPPPPEKPAATPSGVDLEFNLPKLPSPPITIPVSGVTFLGPLDLLTFIHFELTSAQTAAVPITAIIVLAAVVIGVWRPIREHPRRIFILLGASLLAFVIFNFLLWLGSSLASTPALRLTLDVLEHIAVMGMYVAIVGALGILVSKYAPLILAYFADQGLPVRLASSSSKIEILIRRSQRMSVFDRVIFMLDARLGLNQLQLDLTKKYKLGRVLVYDSARRQRQNELARAHLIEAAGGQRPICLWREQWRGALWAIFYLIRAIISFLLGFLFIRIRLAKLVRGVHIESKSLGTILEAKNAFERAAGDLKAYLEVAETFDGREEILEPE